MRTITVLAVALATAACSAQAPTQPAGSAADAPSRPASLQALLDAELPKIPARSGIWVKHLTTGEEGAVRADETFNSASVIKLAVLVLAYQMAEKGALSLDQRITIAAADVRGGSGVFRYHDPGLQPTLRDVLMQMIITSDNTATDIAIAKVGGVAAVNGWLQANGFAPALKLNTTIFEVFRNRYVLADPGAASLTPEDVYALGSGDLAYDVGTYTLSFDGPDGKVTDTGKYVTVWTKVDGEWKVAADIGNSDLPATN